MYQSRLCQLHYSGVAFCHTAFGRLDVNKDDADLVLPWRDLLHSDPKSEDTSTLSSSSFGRRDPQLNMDIYRRINIVFEEVTDVSRFLHPSSPDDTSSSSINDLLQKYDIVSLQPMNEPTLQNICELLPSNNDTTNASSSSSSRPVIDIIVLEYATGSRGGYGLPYRLRKDNLIKTMEAGVAFELCYATATVDPKRRQGFMRTLTDFYSTYSSIQKKHMLLNNNSNNRQSTQSGMNGKMCRSESFPLLISSGTRQNYSAGTDEGMVTLRPPKDVQFLVGQSIGGDAWIDKHEYNEMRFDNNNNNNNKGRKRTMLSSPAERVLANAKDRRLGVVVTRLTTTNANPNKRKLDNATIRAYVSKVSTKKNSEMKSNKDQQTDHAENDDDDSVEDNAESLIDWLSAPLQKRCISKNHDSESDEGSVNEAKQNDVQKTFIEGSSSTKSEATHDPQENDEDDLEDGYLAL